MGSPCSESAPKVLPFKRGSRSIPRSIPECLGAFLGAIIRAITSPSATRPRGRTSPSLAHYRVPQWLLQSRFRLPDSALVPLVSLPLYSCAAVVMSYPQPRATQPTDLPPLACDTSVDDTKQSWLIARHQCILLVQPQLQVSYAPAQSGALCDSHMAPQHQDQSSGQGGGVLRNT